MGFVLTAPGKKTVYFAGDTIWNEYVEIAINKFKPDLIVLNAADSRYEGLIGSAIMGPNDVKKCMNYVKLQK